MMLKGFRIRSSKCRLRRKNIMNVNGKSKCIPFSNQSVFFSDDSRLASNKSRLRSLRKGKPQRGEKEKSIDYRYRGKKSGLMEQLDRPIEELWGDIAKEQQEARQSANREKETRKEKIEMGGKSEMQSAAYLKSRPNFISFFDEVDARMGRGSTKNTDKILSSSRIKIKPKEKKFNSSIDALLDALHNGSPATPPIENESSSESIFDAFPLKPKEVNDPNAYEKKSFEQYHATMKEIVESDRFMRRHTNKPLQDEVIRPVVEWLLNDKRLVEYDYSILKDAEICGISVSSASTDDSSVRSKKKVKKYKKAFRPEVSLEGTQESRFYSQLKKQNDLFAVQNQLSDEQKELAERALTAIASECAKSAKSIPLSIAWEKIKEAGIIPTNDTLNVFLYVTGTMTSSFFSSRSIGLHSKKMNAVMSILGSSVNDDQAEKSDDVNPIDFPTELALFHDLLYRPSEKSISLRVKRLVSSGDAHGAEELLDSFPTNDDAKLRTYLPVLKLYCEQGNVSCALRLFKRMRDEPSVRLEPENYVLLISTFAEHGYFNPNSEPAQGARELGYRYDYGPKFFDELVTEMSEDVLEISAASARRLYNSLAEGMHQEGFTNDVEPIHSLAGVAEENDPSEPNDLIASRVSIGKSTGLCPRSGVKLRLIKLEKQEQKQLHQSLLDLSSDRFEEFQTTRMQRNERKKYQNNAADHLNEFSRWLDEREGEPFTAIVDGANVAYYMQNFHQGSFNIFQLQFVVDALEKSNEKSLVILPSKYFSPSFYTYMGSKQIKQVVSKEERRILQKLKDNDQLYQVPARCLDDYYWMLASVSNQTRSRGEVDLDVASDNVEGRWPGTRPMLITNDQMRDHKLGLMEPRLFRRWTSCYIVNYSFTAFVKAESVDREISFSTADFFSKEIQKNCHSTGTTWHIPVSDWDLYDRLCIRIPHNETNEQPEQRS